MFKNIFTGLVVAAMAAVVSVSGQATVSAGSHHNNDVTPDPVVFTDQDCQGVDPSFTIPSSHGVSYYRTGTWTALSTGLHSVSVGSFVSITARATYGHEISRHATTVWTHTFSAPNCDVVVTPTPVTFVDPTCTQKGSYTIPTQTGVIYLVNEVVKDAGTYTVDSGSKITVDASAAKGYVLEDEAVSSWTHTFVSPTNCETPVTPVTPVTPATPVATPVAATAVSAVPTSLPNTGSNVSLIAVIVTFAAAAILVASGVAKQLIARFF